MMSTEDDSTGCNQTNDVKHEFNNDDNGGSATENHRSVKKNLDKILNSMLTELRHKNSYKLILLKTLT